MQYCRCVQFPQVKYIDLSKITVVIGDVQRTALLCLNTTTNERKAPNIFFLFYVKQKLAFDNKPYHWLSILGTSLTYCKKRSISSQHVPKKWFFSGLSVFECFYFEARSVLLLVCPTSFDLENVLFKHFQYDDKSPLYQ